MLIKTVAVNRHNIKFTNVAPTILARDYKGVMSNHRLHGGVIDIDHLWISDKGVRYVLDSKRGMATDVNADIRQPLTAKGQQNWTGSFISPDIKKLKKGTLIGSDKPYEIELASGEKIMNNEIDGYTIRIRKLSPRECLRLMGQNDDDITKILNTVSNSQAYKQAGNSIVVDVLEQIFKNMIGGTK